jgi:tRNA 2-thiouridine synthesizing protein E
MAYDFNGTEIETTANGYLVNAQDWSKELATHMAAAENIELGDRHWDLINYLRDEFLNNGTQPNTRNIVKSMSKMWGEKLSQKDVYALFNGDPSKIAGKFAGTPESKRKGGY